MPRLRGRSSWRSERRKPSKPRNACGSKPSRAPSSRGRKSYFPLKRSSWMRSTRKSFGRAGEPSDLVLPRTILATRHAVPPDRERKLSIRDGPRPRQESSPPLPRRLRADAPDGNSPNRAGHRRRRVQGGGARSRVEGLRGRPDRARDEPEPRSSVHPDHWVFGGRTPPDDRMVSGPVRRAEHQDNRPGEDVRRAADRNPRGSRPRRDPEEASPPGARRAADLVRGLRSARRDHLRAGPRESRKESIRGGAVERVGGPRDPTLLSEPAVRRAGADGRHPPDARVRPPRGRYCESQDPAPALGLEGDSPVRPVHRGRPGNSEGRVGRNDSDGPERTDRPAAGLRPHRGLVLPPEGLASARGWSARSLGRKAPPARGGALRARPPAVRPANPRLHRAEGAGGPEPSNHREREGECVAVRSHPGPLGGLRWNSPQWAETNSSRDSSWRASGRHSASGATPLRRRSQRSSKTQTSGS